MPKAVIVTLSLAAATTLLIFGVVSFRRPASARARK